MGNDSNPIYIIQLDKIAVKQNKKNGNGEKNTLPYTKSRPKMRNEKYKRCIVIHG